MENSDYTMNKICECGCGIKLTNTKHFIMGHQNRGKNHPMYGKHWSTIIKDKNSKSHIGLQVGIKNGMFGQKHTQQMKDKLSNDRIGKGNPMYGTHLTQEEKDNLSINRMGEKNWNWKGGVALENKEIRHSSEYSRWRKEVLKKNNNTCQKCEEQNGTLRAHHIMGFHNNPELRVIVSNGITFCKECHTEFHRMYGSKNNNQEQIDEYLNEEINEI